MKKVFFVLIILLVNISYSQVDLDFISDLGFQLTPKKVIKNIVGEELTDIKYELTFKNKNIQISFTQKNSGSLSVENKFNAYLKVGTTLKPLWNRDYLEEIGDVIGGMEIYNNDESVFVFFEDFNIGCTYGWCGGQNFSYNFKLYDLLKNKFYNLSYFGLCAGTFGFDDSDVYVFDGEFIINELINYPDILNFLEVKLISSKGIPKKDFLMYKNLYGRNPDVIYAKGKLYKDGVYVTKDNYKANNFFLKSAGMGSGAAQYSLGWIYYNGEDVLVDKKRALNWFEASAENGNKDGQTNLGRMYYQGDVVIQDYKKAHYWFEKAANNRFGSDIAENFLGNMYQFGHGVAINKKKAFEWYKESASKGFEVAEYNLGVMYFNGDGILTDKKKGIQYFESSAESGVNLAQFNLGLIYYQGDGVISDKKKSAYWMRKAYENGNKEAKRFWDEFELWKF